MSHRLRSLAIRYKPFSALWRDIVRSRALLCLLILSLTILDRHINQKALIAVCIAAYLMVQILIGFVDSDILQLNTVRVIPSVVDVILVTVIMALVGGPENPWFLIYFFPIISVSRYLGYKGTISLASFSAGCYLFLYLVWIPQSDLNPYSLFLRTSSLFGIAAVAGNLAKAKHTEEVNISSAVERIDNAMLSNMDPAQVFHLILTSALQITGSEMGHIRLVNFETGEAELAVAVGHPRDSNWGMKPLDDSYSRQVIKSGEALIIPEIGKVQLRRHLGVYFRLHRPRPRSALFVPLVIENLAVGVIAVYSRRRLHYKKTDLRRLRTFASLVGIAQKNAQLYKESAGAVKESQQRLSLLYQLGERLKSPFNLIDLFNEVVELTVSQLNSEEAALFIPDYLNKGRIRKVAVIGPSDEVTERLRAVETSYARGESLAGRIFDTKKEFYSNSVPQTVEYVNDYSEVLPSEEIRHYIGVPLFIGDEVLGVLRVINRKAIDYCLKEGNVALSMEGFLEKDDVELMKTIASQVSIAIKNTNLLEAERVSALGRVSQTVGHEIKTDIAAALNYIEVLLFESDQKDRDILAEVKDALNSSIEKLQNLLMASQPKAPSKSVVRVDEFLREFENQISGLAKIKEVEFTIQHESEFAYEIFADTTQLNQVFANFFNNSLYAISENGVTQEAGRKGRIILSARVVGHEVRLRWEDNGSGIAERDISKLFTPFFTTKTTGSGLGLFIVKTIIENHNGTISVSSREGVGTCFEVSLPILESITQPA